MGNRILFIAFIGIALSILSCKKEKESPYWGEASSLKNGVEWRGEIKARINRLSDSKADISIEQIRPDGFLENLYFFKVPIIKGKHWLSPTINQPPDDSLVGGKFFVSADDLLYDVYHTAHNDSISYFEITDYNERMAIIKGNFSLTLWRRMDWPGTWNAPDSIVFSNGTFHTRIRD